MPENKPAYPHPEAKPVGGKRYFDKKPEKKFGEKKFGDKPSFGERRFGDRKPAFGAPRAERKPRPVNLAPRRVALETLLDRCDPTDRQLFFGLLQGEKPEVLQQKLFLSSSALRHREKNLMLWAGCAAREDWQAFRAFCRALPLSDE